MSDDLEFNGHREEPLTLKQMLAKLHSVLDELNSVFDDGEIRAAARVAFNKELNAVQKSFVESRREREAFVTVPIGVDKDDASRCAPENGCPLLVCTDRSTGKLSCPFEPEPDSDIYSSWEDGARSPECLAHSTLFDSITPNNNVMEYIIDSLSNRMKHAIEILFNMYDENGRLFHDELVSFKVTGTMDALRKRGIINLRLEFTEFGFDVLDELSKRGEIKV